MTALILLAGLALAQTASPPVGQRTARPESMLSGIDAALGGGENDPAIVAAQAFPLGSPDNPVRVGGPEGAGNYIGRLRCGDGTRPQVGGPTDGGVGAFGSVVQRYVLQCPSSTPASILVDIYHEEHVEDRAVPGFTILTR
jgi:hypothetical protein